MPESVLEILVSTPPADDAPLSVSVEVPEEAPVAVQIPAAQPVTVEVREASAGPAGETGPAGPQGPAGPAGPAGANAEFVVLTLAAYLALPPATQVDGRWYVIPRTA